MPKFNYYDIESLDNVFSLCNYRPSDDELDIYYLVDDNAITDDFNFEKNLKRRTFVNNRAFKGYINLFNLKKQESNEHLAQTFGLTDTSDCKADSYGNRYCIIKDTDSNYDNEQHPYFVGYNSYNYDTVMLALYFNEVFYIDPTSKKVTVKPPTAALMRQYNNDLFLPEFKNNMPSYLKKKTNQHGHYSSANDRYDRRNLIRQNMLMTGRYIDAARLNEKQQKVGLKRLLGMIGYQILESDKLTGDKTVIENSDELYDLLAYNASDVINLRNLFEQPYYKAQFDLKYGLLQTYPELVYQQKNGSYAPDINPDKVRQDRLFVDSSSAQFAAKSLCPYGRLKDIPTVSFMYPSKAKAKELGIKQINILDEQRNYFYRLYPLPEHKNIREQFDKIYQYYKAIEGKNFNMSQRYIEDYQGTPEYQKAISISDIPKTDNCLCYFDKDGKPSSGFITFSIGGIHGAEYNKAKFEYERQQILQSVQDMEYVQSKYPNPIDLKAQKNIEMPDGRIVSATEFLKSGSTLKKASYKDLKVKQPVLFKKTDDGGCELNKQYTYTSVNAAIHQDFSSYYPGLLRNLSAFYNGGLGYDRYAEIYGNKEKYGKLMKDKTLSEEKRTKYAILREGTKLILNSASGAADAAYDTPIRMNNMIMSMRIIGQLFSWHIGQAETYYGATIISTNTDGLYSVYDFDKTVKILAQESKNILVDIEPELLGLVSKDSNNRMETDIEMENINSASGGTLGCRNGPNVTKALSHPAVIDWCLAEYLLHILKNEESISEPFNKTLGMKILQSVKDKFSKVDTLRMYQNILASSTGSMNYVFGLNYDYNDPNSDRSAPPVILQHYNRAFIVKKGTQNAIHLCSANARKVSAPIYNKRKSANERLQQHDMLALDVLAKNGVPEKEIPFQNEAIIKKVTGIEQSWYMLIVNKSLYELSESECDAIIDSIDYDKYLTLLADCFEKNWRNEYYEPIETNNDNNNNNDDVPFDIDEPLETQNENDEQSNIAANQPLNGYTSDNLPFAFAPSQSTDVSPVNKPLDGYTMNNLPFVFIRTNNPLPKSTPAADELPNGNIIEPTFTFTQLSPTDELVDDMPFKYTRLYD